MVHVQQPTVGRREHDVMDPDFRHAGEASACLDSESDLPRPGGSAARDDPQEQHVSNSASAPPAGPVPFSTSSSNLGGRN